MGPEQWLFLQWHEHKGSLVSTFEKLFERNVFVDCTLAAEGQQLNVHKMILSACSPYFEILLNENRDKHPIIILKDVKFRSLKSIIEYMYRGEANVLSTEIKDFLSAAETLQIKGLGKQDGGDNRGQPAKDLRDLVEESLPPCSTEMPIGIGEKENWRGPDHLSSVLSEAAHENAAPKNILFSQGDMGRNISPQKIPVQALCAQEIETEKPWLKTEGIGETSQCLKSVLPTLNLGTHSIEPVHPGSMDQVPEKYACSTSIQNVQKISDVQMDMEMAPKHEPEHAVQSTSVPPDNEEAETASIVSSVIELSDTTEEWAEEDMEEGPTGSQATANSFAGGTDESRAHFDGASDATRDSVSRDLGSDQQERPRTTDSAPALSSSEPKSSEKYQQLNSKDLELAELIVTTEGRDKRQQRPLTRKSSSQQVVRDTHVCPECKKAFPWLSSLKQHMLSHKGEKQLFGCEECSFVAKKYSELVVHQRTHLLMWSGESPCAITRSRSPSPRVKRSHRVRSLDRSRKLIKSESVSVLPTILPPAEKKIYKCTQCGTEFTSMSKYTRHIYSFHGSSTNPFTL